MITAALGGVLIAFIFLMAFMTPSPLDHIGDNAGYRQAWRRHHRWTLLAIVACCAMLSF